MFVLSKCGIYFWQIESGDIAQLSVNLSFFLEENATLYLSKQDGETKLIAGPLNREC